MTAEASRRWRERHPGLDAERARQYRQTAKGKAALSAQGKDWRRRNPEKYAAHRAVVTAIRHGEMTRQPCHCGKDRSYAHHHNGYDAAHQLDVIWLCAVHHHAEHKRMREQG